MNRILGLAACAVFAALLAGCGSPPPGAMQPLDFPATPFETVVSSMGLLHVDVRWSPANPVKGENAVQLTFSDALGNAIDGLSVAVVPWMPAHGHGTSIQPLTAPTAPGVVVATPVYLFMSGEWQLRMSITGSLNDSAVATVQIP